MHIMEAAGRRWNPVWYYRMVRTGGPWDYKHRPEYLFSDDTYEYYGNFEFGPTCSAFTGFLRFV
jgi:hypothetical protein